MRTADPLRITQFVTTFEAGGTERQFRNLAVGLDAEGHDVRFGCINRTGRLLDDLTARGIGVREYRLRSFYSTRFFSQQVAFARDLSRDRAEVVHAYNLYGNVFAVPAARMAGVPVVIGSIRDCGVYLTDWTRRVQRAVCRLADHLIVNAESIKDWLVGDGYRADRITVVRNGVDFGPFADGAVADLDLHREFGIPAGAPIISTIARLCPSKGFDEAIDAMPVVLRHAPDAHLLIAGQALVSTRGELHLDHSYRDALARRAAEIGVAHRVIFAGHRTDVPAILRGVTLSVQPSRTEGLSNSILEAMASGRAVVATPVGGTPEVIRHDRTGWLVPARDPRALGEAIALLLSDAERRRRLGEAARDLVWSTLSIEALVRRTEEVYRDLLDRKRTRRSTPSRAA